MAGFQNPALLAFVAQIPAELVFGQVLIRREAASFALRHEADHAADDSSLRKISASEVRELAQTTAHGAFRPLKSAPNLRRGWRFFARDADALDEALLHFHPGGVADWFAAHVAGGNPPVTHYREFTNRQSGMYRITAMLPDEPAGRMIRACCDRRFCLKRRLWTVAGIAPDAITAKSVIPCLEPCALLLEFARQAMRLEQEKATVPASPIPDVTATLAAVHHALEHPDLTAREADFSAPDNPRRLLLRQLELQGFTPVAPAASVE